jgi:hypothetical protein
MVGFFRGTEMMQKGNNHKQVVKAEAVVHRVDPVNRELAALVGGVLVAIYVPPGCEVVLHGERVKLRMIQPRDRVRVAYTELADSLVAREIKVQPASPTASLPQ